MKKTKKIAPKKPSQVFAASSLLINAIIMPGLGTLIGGKIKEGLIQLFVLFLGGLVIIFIGILLGVISPIAGSILAVLGGLMVIASWIWGIVSGALLVRAAAK
jgi:hypothetical protein